MTIFVSVRFGTIDRFVVDGDLREGDEVVIEGNRLMPGQPLKAVQSSAKADPPACGRESGDRSRLDPTTQGVLLQVDDI